MCIFLYLKDEWRTLEIATYNDVRVETLTAFKLQVASGLKGDDVEDELLGRVLVLLYSFWM